MKKVLFIMIVCALFGSVTANANEYKLEEVKRCDDQRKKDYDDVYSCDVCPDICDLNGSAINGTLSMNFIFNTLKIPYVNGKKDGVQKEFRPKDVLSAETNYKDGKKEGVQKKYYEDGSVSYEATYKDGKLNGNEKHIYADGKLETDIVYKDGERDGYSRSYYKDGTMFVETNYKVGKMDGIQTIYYYPKNKVLKEEREYKDDQLISKRYYDENGKEVDEKTFSRMRM